MNFDVSRVIDGYARDAETLISRHEDIGPSDRFQHFIAHRHGAGTTERKVFDGQQERVVQRLEGLAVSLPCQREANSFQMINQ